MPAERTAILAARKVRRLGCHDVIVQLGQIYLRARSGTLVQLSTW